MGYNIDITSNNGNLTSKSFYLPENPASGTQIKTAAMEVLLDVAMPLCEVI